ncbi:MAG: ABC transporter ATP-binding protein [Clostridia bacterium]|nr:ABC transporter ATP-binding protein [Clostridia bacterium]
MIRVNGLTKSYGTTKAVNGIDFSLSQGEMLGFLGVNGAGKSTTVNMLSTLIKSDGGTCRICGYELGKQDNEIRKHIGIVYQQNCLDEILTVEENLICRGRLRTSDKRQLKATLAHLSDLLSLQPILKKRYNTLSGGQKRRCEIAAALMHTPKLLFLDEPTTGLDPATRKDVWAVIDQLRKNEGLTVFLTTHYMEEAALADRIIIINKGSIMAQGTPFELKEKYARDTVKLYTQDQDKVIRTLSQMSIEAKKTPYGASFFVNGTQNAIEPIYKIRDMIDGFEVIAGNMDDVFLNVCGTYDIKEEEK